MDRYLWILLPLLMVACVGQDPPEVEPNTAPTENERNRRVICGNVNLGSNLLDYQNQVNFFQCVGWDKIYPSIFAALKEIPQAYWNHLFKGIDDYFFNNISKRNQYLAYLKELDEQEGLDDLSFIMQNFFDANFNDYLYRILVNSEKNNKKNSHPSKDEIKNLFKLLNTNPIILKNLAHILSSFNAALQGENRNLKDPMWELIQDPLFNKIRLDFVDSAMQQMIHKNPSAADRDFTASIFELKEADTGLPALYRWLNDDDFNYGHFLNIVEFPALEYPNIGRDAREVVRMFPYARCKRRGQDTSLELDIEKEFKGVVSSIVVKSYEGFMQYNLEAASKLQLADAACEIGMLANDVNLFKFFNRTIDFFELEGTYNLTRLVHFLPVTIEKGADPLHFVKLMDNDMLPLGLELNKLTHRKQTKIWWPLYHIWRDFPFTAYLSAGVVVKHFFDKGPFEILRVGAKIWHQLTDREKQIIVNFIDHHFEPKVQYLKLRKFYQQIINDFPNATNVLAEHLASDEEKRELTFQALKSLAKNFKGEEVLADMRRLFSRDGIVSIIRILTTGVDLPPSGDEGRPFPGPVPPPGESDPDDGKPPAIAPIRLIKPSPLQRERVRKLAACINDLTLEGRTFYDLAHELPESCHQIDTNHFSFKLFGWMNAIGKDFADKFGYQIFDDKGLLSKNVLNSTLSTGLIMERTLASSKSAYKGIELFLRTLKEHFFEIEHKRDAEKKGYFDLALNFIQLLYQMQQSNLSGTSEWRDFVLTKGSELRDEDIVKFSQDLALVMHDFGNYRPIKKNYVQKHPCKDFHLYQFDWNPCPDSSKILSGVQTFIEGLAVEYEDVPSYTDQFAEALLPGPGVPWPLDHDPPLGHYRMTLEDTLVMFYDAGDNKYRREIEFQGKEDKDRKKYMASLVERIEVTIREASFDENVIGGYFKNSMAKTEHYADEAAKSHGLFKMCSKWLRWCGVWLNKEKRRMAFNAVSAFPSLIQVDDEFEHPGLGTYRYGNWIQTFIIMMVASSDKSSQRSTWFKIWFPFKGWVKLPYFMKMEERLKHRGRMFREVTRLGGFRNLSRFIRDRLADSEEELVKLVKSFEFQRLHHKIFYGLPLEKTQKTLNEIIAHYATGKDPLLLRMAEDLIDWIESHDYADLRLLEDTIYHTFQVLSFLGTDEFEPGTRGMDADFRNHPEFENLGLHKVLELLDLAIGLYPSVKEYWPEDLGFTEVLQHIHDFLVFMEKGLIREFKNPNKMAYYRLLNNLYKMSEVLLLRREELTISGFELFAQNLKENPGEVLQLTQGLIRYYERLQYDRDELTGEWKLDKWRFSDLGQNLHALVSHRHFNLTAFKDYLKLTSLPILNGEENSHYGEVSTLLEYLATSRPGDGQNRFRIMTETLLNEELENLIDFIDEAKELIRFRDDPHQKGPSFLENIGFKLSRIN